MTVGSIGIKMGDVLWQLLLSLERSFLLSRGALGLPLKHFSGKLIEMLSQGRTAAQTDIKRLLFIKGAKSDHDALPGQTVSASSCDKPGSILVYECLPRGRYGKPPIPAEGMTFAFLAWPGTGADGGGTSWERDAPEIRVHSFAELC